jgi:hypothetical protein
MRHPILQGAQAGIYNVERFSCLLLEGEQILYFTP